MFNQDVLRNQVVVNVKVNTFCNPLIYNGCYAPCSLVMQTRWGTQAANENVSDLRDMILTLPI